MECTSPDYVTVLAIIIACPYRSPNSISKQASTSFTQIFIHLPYVINVPLSSLQNNWYSTNNMVS